MNDIVAPGAPPKKPSRHDALAAILPASARERMAQVLTADDFATLRHLAEKGTGPNTLRAITSMIRTSTNAMRRTGCQKTFAPFSFRTAV